MSCNGFSADTYDRFVLGLLDANERSQIDEQIEQQCDICLRGVQRSMNLWLVYATTLDNAEPSADFRARLVRMADLSKRVLTFPKRARSLNEPRILVSSLVVACLALGILMVLTWIAGRHSGQMDAQRSTAEFEQLERENTTNRLDLEREIERNRSLTEKPTSSSRLANVQDQKKLADQYQKAQADIEQYKAIFKRESDLRSESSRIVDTLSLPGARLLQLRGPESAASGSAPVGYAVIVENSRLVFVGSNLTAPTADHQFQIWIVRKEEPKYVSAGLLTVDEKKRAVAYYDADASSISEVLAVEVTEEPTFGSKEPLGPKILESSVPASAAEIN